MHKRRLVTPKVVGMAILLMCLWAIGVLASDGNSSAGDATTTPAASTTKPSANANDQVTALKQQMALQQKQIEQMQKALEEQKKLLEQLTKPALATAQAAQPAQPAKPAAGKDQAVQPAQPANPAAGTQQAAQGPLADSATAAIASPASATRLVFPLRLRCYRTVRGRVRWGTRASSRPLNTLPRCRRTGSRNRYWRRIDCHNVTTSAARARSGRRHTVHCALDAWRSAAAPAASHCAAHARHQAPSGSRHETSASPTGSARRARSTASGRSATGAQQSHAARHGSNSCRRNRADRTGYHRGRHRRSDQIGTAHLQ